MKFIRQLVRKAQEVYNVGSNKFAYVLREHSPALLEHSCAGHLNRFWNRLLVSGTVLDELLKDCERFVLEYYCIKIQKQWRKLRIRRHFEAVLIRSKYLTSLTHKAKLWKTQNGCSLSIDGRCV
jgi:hypothetical protein